MPAALSKARRAIPDGRLCRLCSCKDSDPDLTFPEMCMHWGFPPGPETNKNQGRLCFYCFRVYNAEYASKFKNLAAFLKAFGEQGSDLMVKFNSMREQVITICKDKQMTVGVVVEWSQVRAVVQTVTSNEVEAKQNPDTIMLYKDYVVKHGDPAKNGHQRGQYKGHDVVTIPGRLEWKVYKTEKKASG
ncbi:unnamed protein product [Prorocentrum cordatum]|uniref:ZAD domain-containing protein n=1 Tax=Prorocentrum cordatum TaxID=2364126 RepID=A0ABN9QQM4_9DINO|nr:unnamed protein product [Polarella glacialis]